jgi:hypothetical protein
VNSIHKRRLFFRGVLYSRWVLQMLIKVKKPIVLLKGKISGVVNAWHQEQEFINGIYIE